MPQTEVNGFKTTTISTLPTDHDCIKIIDQQLETQRHIRRLFRTKLTPVSSNCNQIVFE